MAFMIPIAMVMAVAASTAGTIYSMVSRPETPQAPTPTQQQATTQQQLESAYAEAQLLRKRSGFESTIITGPQGVLGAQPSTRHTLGA